MRKERHVPIRTCIGCRKKGKKEEMIWLTQGPEGVGRVNQRRPHQGRGFYLCPDVKCYHMARKKNKGIGFLETMDFQVPLAKDFLKREKRLEVEEEGNDKK